MDITWPVYNQENVQMSPDPFPCSTNSCLLAQRWLLFESYHSPLGLLGLASAMIQGAVIAVLEDKTKRGWFLRRLRPFIYAHTQDKCVLAISLVKTLLSENAKHTMYMCHLPLILLQSVANPLGEKYPDLHSQFSPLQIALLPHRVALLLHTAVPKIMTLTVLLHKLLPNLIELEWSSLKLKRENTNNNASPW